MEVRSLDNYNLETISYRIADTEFPVSLPLSFVSRVSRSLLCYCLKTMRSIRRHHNLALCIGDNATTAGHHYYHTERNAVFIYKIIILCALFDVSLTSVFTSVCHKIIYFVYIFWYN